VFDKFNQLRENWPTRFSHPEHRAGGASVGRGPRGSLCSGARWLWPPIQVFHRLAETGGKTGRWLSDLLRTILPTSGGFERCSAWSSRFLRAAWTFVAGSRRPISKVAASDLDFGDWDQPEALHGVTSNVQLDPLLRPPLVT